MTTSHWQDYQKQVPDDHYFYVRSCIRQTFFPGAETALLKILREDLKKDVFEDRRHTTCTGIGYHSDIIPLETIMTVVSRQFALMNEAGYKNLLVSCVTSFGIYLEILDMWRHFPEKLAETRDALWKSTRREFEVPELVSHASDVIFHFKEKIGEGSSLRLVNCETGNSLNVVEHVGCHYAKIFPQDGIGGAEFPRVLSGLIEAWGGKVVDYPERRHCCGFGFRNYLVQENRGYSVSNSRVKFESMAPYNPDFILTNCPGCNMFLDRWQYTLSEMNGTTYDKEGCGIPVLTHEELAGLMVGMDPWKLGLQMHQVPVEPLLDKLGIRYNRKEKYYLAGKAVAKPEAPSILMSSYSAQ
jgi:heterodisulfide reductase subunit B